MSDRPAIVTDDLTKRFGAHTAVDHLSLTVPQGSVYGFLGPNGSGKTTTIRMLLGLVAPSAGRAEVLGRVMPRGAREVLPRVGALVEGPAFYPFLTGAANLARLDTADPLAPSRTRRARVGEALERVGLAHAAAKKVHAYSLGMKQRLGLAAALLAPRTLLMLDEPTNGLDPQGTREVRALIRSLAEDGTTVFVSSHLLAEVEQVCTHAAVLRTGRLVAQGTLDSLRGASRPRLTVRTPDAAAAARVLRGLSFDLEPAGPETVVAAAREAPGAEAAAHDGARPPAAEDVVAALVAAGVRVRGFTAEAATLEERFVELTGEGFDVAG
ncbi:ABC transporter ATP-binding protein [Sinomonas cellulolyticus]|uniref:ATP-binding cassette domain-containing protein n=1 Tax=Sinomonas cellulolyticus TaxID=2801916 RepID=A0ABS1K4Y0_9MICC|nr:MULTISPECIES: ATP-binding cassette domain-containing protein [Sinomonas]MBL0706711.1 ATP-binding cassette domain-containing protein [Sinomonas cellulolyticus]GHG56276.1 ABC transporter ATP-binding protein [Sinomonas sp. KCTC 49339]